MAVSLAHARQTGHCMERRLHSSVVEGAAIAAVEPDETAVVSTPDEGGAVALWLDHRVNAATADRKIAQTASS